MPISKCVSCLFSPHKLNHFLRRISLTYQYPPYPARSLHMHIHWVLSYQLSIINTYCSLAFSTFTFTFDFLPNQPCWPAVLIPLIFNHVLHPNSNSRLLNIQHRENFTYLKILGTRLVSTVSLMCNTRYKVPLHLHIITICR
jgi:hypothetical protein